GHCQESFFYSYAAAREFFTQQGQRALQMTLDSVHGHIQGCRDVGGVEVFLIAEDHDHAGRFGERSDQAVEGLGEKGIASGGDGGKVAVEGEEDILSDLVGEGAVAEEVPADTEDHGLMAVDEAGEIESGLRRVFQNIHGWQL